MQTSVELLHAILQVVGKIEQNQAGQKKAESKGGGDGSIASKLGSAVKSFAGVKEKDQKSFFTFMKGMMDIAKDTKNADVKKLNIISESLTSMGNSLPGIAEGLADIGRIRSQRVERAVRNLQMLYKFMEESGDSRSIKRVDRAVKTFDKMGRALQKIARPIKDITLGFAYLGLGILALAGSLLLTSKLLQVASPKDAIFMILGLVGGVVLMFGLLALARRAVDKGTDVIKDIGLGMAALSLGIISFALTIRILPIILGDESNGSIVRSMLIMIGIVAAMSLMFAMLSFAQKFTKKGFISILLMSLGLAVLSVAIIGLAMAGKYLLGGSIAKVPGNEVQDEKDENKRLLLKGLGVMGLVILGAVALFTLLGIPGFSGIVKSGAITMLLMGAALLVMGESVKKLVGVSKELGDTNVRKSLGDLIGGTLEGFIDGISSLSGGKKGVKGIAEFIKNSAKIFAGTAVLMSMSLALSQFAKAISAFAQLEQMRVIEGYDKDGKPIFGDKVNVTQVANNITTSIKTFLDALLESTEDLTIKKSRAIKKMARALTGRRGILGAVIQFADALKTYAEFGESNEIGYIDYDDEGNEVRKKVSANAVVDNVIGSFLYFTERLFGKSEEEFGDGEAEGQGGITGKQKRRVKRMAKALTGKHGILGAVIQFSETLRTFSQFGKDNMIPVYDADGNLIDEMSISDVTDNIIKALTTFSDDLGTKLEKQKPKDAEKAIGKYEKLINQLNKLSSSMDSLQKLTVSIQDLADGIGDLGVNLEALDAAKLAAVIDSITSGSMDLATTPRTYRASGGPTTTAASPRRETETTTKSGEPKWDAISEKVGETVSANMIAAMKSGQVKFVFSGGPEGIMEWGE